MEITEQKIKTSFLLSLISVILSACSGSNQANGASWEGQVNFMHVTKEKMQMTYSVDITGQTVFKGGYYEIVRKNTDAIIFRLTVNELEFGIREDGRNFCRVWGEVDESKIQSYLYALDCKAIF